MGSESNCMHLSMSRNLNNYGTRFGPGLSVVFSPNLCHGRNLDFLRMIIDIFKYMEDDALEYNERRVDDDDDDNNNENANNNNNNERDILQDNDQLVIYSSMLLYYII